MSKILKTLIIAGVLLCCANRVEAAECDDTIALVAAEVSDDTMVKDAAEVSAGTVEYTSELNETAVPVEDVEVTDFPDSDVLLGQYVEELFGGNQGISLLSLNYGEQLLNETERNVYNYVKPHLAAVAAGKEADTLWEIPISVLGFEDVISVPVNDIVSLTYTNGAWVSGGIYNQSGYDEAKAKISEQLGINSRNVFLALQQDCPSELYWFGRAYYIGASFSYSWSTKPDRTTSSTTGYANGYVKCSKILVRMKVDSGYVANGATYKADTTKTSAANVALQNAIAIVAKYANLNDYEKLLAYKTELCKLNSYNNEAAKNDVSQDGSLNAWEIIWMFDGDSNTNVVCEGYAKGFQYLCEKSSFNNDIWVNSVSGYLNDGAHRWNIVNWNGKNYLVDVTSCDSDNVIGGHDKMFMKGYESGNIKDGYTITRASFKCDNGATVTASKFKYQYNPNTLALYEYMPEYLTLQNSDFNSSTDAVVSVAVNAISVSMDDKIRLNFYMDIPDAIRETCVVKINGNVVQKTYTNDSVNVSCAVLPKCIDDLQTVQVYDSNGQIVKMNNTNGAGEAYSSSVSTYLMTLKRNASSYSPELIALADALLTYGRCAEKYFGYNVPETVPAVGNVDTEAYAAVVNGTLSEGVTYLGATASVLDEGKVRLYFEGDPGALKITSGFKAVKKAINGGYYVEIYNLSAADYGKTFKLTAGSWSVQYSVYAYVQQVLEAEKNNPAAVDPSLSALTKSMYLYGGAAKKYLISINEWSGDVL